MDLFEMTVLAILTIIIAIMRYRLDFKKYFILLIGTGVIFFILEIYYKDSNVQTNYLKDLMIAIVIFFNLDWMMYLKRNSKKKSD